MHSFNNVKFINAQQAKLINIYKNTKVNLHKTNAAMWYNKVCRGVFIKVNNKFNGALVGTCQFMIKIAQF
jgi:hypothetical protein